MNHSSSSTTPDPAVTSSSAMPPRPAGPRASGAPGAGGLRLLYAAVAALTLLMLASWWSMQREIGDLREDMAARLRSAETLVTENKVMLRSMQDGVREMQGKVSMLEGRQTEAQSQQLALEQMYQELSRTRDDWALAEIEQVLSTASQQLQLAGNVQGAVIALQNADNRLVTSDKPQFIIIRRAIAKDLERLKALPTVDLAGLALRLDSVIGQVDGMPLLAGEKAVLPATEPKTSRGAANSQAAGAASAGSAWLAVLEEKWRSWSTEMWNEVRQLVRVRDVTMPDALLLTPTQSYYVRENLKLRLLNARLALLTRNESAFRSDLSAAQDAIARYFDTRARQTQTVQSLLRQVHGSNLSIEMPTLAESLNAVRNYKATP